MDRRRFLAAVCTASLGSLAGCAPAPDSDTQPTPPTTQTPMTVPQTLTNGSFEAGLANWSVGSDLPTDPNKDGTQPVDASVSPTTEVAADGDRALALSIDGRQDDGTLWVQQAVDLTDAATLAVDCYSEQESFNTISKVATYTGPEPDSPLTEQSFDTSEAVEDHAGWKTYEYDIAHDGPGLVAVGISVVWETEFTRYIDNVRLR